MSNPDRLNGLDTSFLDLERDVAHMHVAACQSLAGYLRDAVDALVRAARSARPRSIPTTNRRGGAATDPGGASRGSRGGRLRVVKSE